MDALQGHGTVQVVGLHLAPKGVVALPTISGGGPRCVVEGEGIAVVEELQVLLRDSALLIPLDEATRDPACTVVACSVTLARVRFAEGRESAAEAIHVGEGLEVLPITGRRAVLRTGVNDRVFGSWRQDAVAGQEVG